MVALDLELPVVDGRPGEPPLVRHRVADHTWMLRQSLRVTFEAPVMYLLLGEHTALLLDTGASTDERAFPLRPTVDEIVAGWLAAYPCPGYRLVVAHTHAHGDHVAGDAQLRGRPDTDVVGTDLASVRSYFGFGTWPSQEVVLDLGGRALTVTGAPGHHPTHIVVHDPVTGMLLTGDTVYPGRLYVSDLPAYVDTLDRATSLADRLDVRHVMGAHVEMSRRPGHDFPIGSTRHRDEAPLPMTVAQLRRVRDAARAAVGHPGVHGHGDFALWNGPCRTAAAWQVVRTTAGRLRRS